MDLLDYAAGAGLLAANPSVSLDNHGNISVRVSDECMFIKPSGFTFKHVGETHAASLVRFFLEDGKMNFEVDRSMWEPSVDTIHHAWIYHLNPSIGSIVHTHSPYATAFAMAVRSLRCYSTEQADLLGGAVNCLRYQDFDSWGKFSANLIASNFLSEDGGDSCRALLLAHHGALTFGEDAVSAAKRAVALEQIAQKNYLAETLGAHEALDFLEVSKWSKRYDQSYGQKK